MYKMLTLSLLIIGTFATVIAVTWAIGTSTKNNQSETSPTVNISSTINNGTNRNNKNKNLTNDDSFSDNNKLSNCIIDAKSKKMIDKGKEYIKGRNYQSAVKYFASLKNTSSKLCVIAKINIFLGDSYKKQDNFVDARLPLNEAKNYFENLSNYKKEYAIALKSLGEVEKRALNPYGFYSPPLGA